MEFIKANITAVLSVLVIVANIVLGLNGFGPLKTLGSTERIHIVDAGTFLDAVNNMDKDTQLLDDCIRSLDRGKVNAKAEKDGIPAYSVAGSAILGCTVSNNDKDKFRDVANEIIKAVMVMSDDNTDYIGELLTAKTEMFVKAYDKKNTKASKKTITPRDEALEFCKKDMPMEIGFCMAKSGFELE